VSYLAVMGCDPGHATGAAWCVCDATGTIRTRMGQPPSPPQTAALRGSYVVQADRLCAILRGFKNTAHAIQRRTQQEVSIIVAIEDFVLTRMKSSEREGLDPVRVTSAFITAMEERNLQRGVRVVYQSPSDAKSYATNDRLRYWGVWKVGAEEHERDAMRHMLLAITKHGNVQTEPRKVGV
jgi:hypothetical protein